MRAYSNSAFAKHLKAEAKSRKAPKRFEGEQGRKRTATHEGEARLNLAAMARRCLDQHDHEDEITLTPLERENCLACALHRQHTLDEPPNVSGWLRIYIQGGEEVPEHWAMQELEAAKQNNPAYYEAILIDINTYGIKLLQVAKAVDESDFHTHAT